MKSLIESILDDENDVMNHADEKVSQYAKEMDWIKSIVDFTKDYFVKAYRGHEFCPIQDIRHKNHRKPITSRREYDRHILTCEGVDAREWKTTYYRFRGELMKFIKAKDEDLYEKFSIDDNDLDDINMYIDRCLSKRDYNIISCSYVYPKESYFAWERSEEGGVKITVRLPI